MRIPAEHDEQETCECAEAENAVRERKPVTLVHELAGEIAIARQDRREPREIGVRRIGGKDENQHRRRLNQVVRKAAPLEDTPRKLRNHCFVLAREDSILLRQ